MTDYVTQALRNKQLFEEDTNISDINKKYVQTFANQYHVSAPSEAIFYRSMRLFMQHSQDIKKEMHSREVINAIALKLRDEFAVSTYQTIMSRVRTICIWLNEGVKPKGLFDIKISRKKYERKLNASDMISWDDFDKLKEQTNSVQLKALMAVLLDGGFRPSEFINLTYKDPVFNRPFYIVEVSGKTGQRMVTLYKSSAYLLRWLQEHPTKKPNDPLWIVDTPHQSRRNSVKNRNKEVIQYTVPAIKKRLATLFKSANINKPCDIYNFRHSCAVNMTLHKVHPDLRAKKLGHSIEIHTATYGRFDNAQTIEAFRQAYGINKQEDKKEISCQYCQCLNSIHNDYCVQCNNPLKEEVAFKEKMTQENRLKSMEETIAKLATAIELNKSPVLDVLDNEKKQKTKEKA